jgi:hypothetical protein
MVTLGPTDDVDGAAETRLQMDESAVAPRWPNVAAFLVGALVAPLLATAAARISPSSGPWWLPLALMLTLAAASTIRWKALGLGLVTGTLLWGIFIIWLTAAVSPDW